MTPEEWHQKYPWGPELIKQFREIFGEVDMRAKCECEDLCVCEIRYPVDMKYNSIEDPKPMQERKPITKEKPFI